MHVPGGINYIEQTVKYNIYICRVCHSLPYIPQLLCNMELDKSGFQWHHLQLLQDLP